MGNRSEHVNYSGDDLVAALWTGSENGIRKRSEAMLLIGFYTSTDDLEMRWSALSENLILNFKEWLSCRVTESRWVWVSSSHLLQDMCQLLSHSMTKVWIEAWREFLVYSSIGEAEPGMLWGIIKAAVTKSILGAFIQILRNLFGVWDLARQSHWSRVSNSPT